MAGLALRSVLAIVTAAGMVLLLRWLYGLIRHREGMGLGDVKLMALLAAWLGLPATLLAFLIGTFLGAIAGIAVILFPSRREDPKDWATTRLPFGTFLCIGGIVASLWGVAIINAYMRWVGL
jgi:leader peptidase (prepilin peptidase)/N-methyltransferase